LIELQMIVEPPSVKLAIEHITDQMIETLELNKILRTENAGSEAHFIEK